MSQPDFAAIDRYITDRLAPHDPALEQALQASREAGLPAINVAPNQGKLLHLLAGAIGAKRILEIGTLGGYSSIWLARALPADGRLVTLEASVKHADVARGNLARAGVAERVEVRVGPALDALPTLAEPPASPFDLTFIDADKQNTPAYFDWALRLTRPGGLIVVDNVIRQGAIADPDRDDPGIRGMRAFFDRLAAEPRVRATAIQTVGSKGHDGLALAWVLAN